MVAQSDLSTTATREQLLEAAGDVFAEVGFRSATVREICNRAEANIAAINYHFGDKEKLYHAVLKESCKRSAELYPPTLGLTPHATPEERLYVFAFSFLQRMFASGPSARQSKLMMREMIEPTSALDKLVKEDIQPKSCLLCSIIEELAGREIDEETLRLCSMSVVSQLTFYNHCQPVVVRMFPEMKFDAAGLEKLARHITRFSLAAIREMTRATTPRSSK